MITSGEVFPATGQVYSEAAVRSKFGRIKAFYKAMAEFEDHTGGGGDGDDDGLDDDEKIARKLQSCKRAGLAGECDAKSVKKWRELGWYDMMNDKYVRRISASVPRS